MPLSLAACPALLPVRSEGEEPIIKTGERERVGMRVQNGRRNSSNDDVYVCLYACVNICIFMGFLCI